MRVVVDGHGCHTAPHLVLTPNETKTKFLRYTGYILNKSENATPKLFAIYIQNYANQDCNGKCILMFKYWVMHNSKMFTDVVTMKHMKAI